MFDTLAPGRIRSLPIGWAERQWGCVMGLIYQVRKQTSRFDAVHHGQHLYRLHWLNDGGNGTAEGFSTSWQR
jgi:hypothetical protein